MDIILPQTRAQLEAERKEIPVSAMCTEVRSQNGAGPVQYRIIGPNRNVGGGRWARSSRLIVPDDSGFTKAIPGALHPSKFGDKAWHAEIDGLRARAKSLVAFEELGPQVFTDTPLVEAVPAAMDANGVLPCFKQYGHLQFTSTETGLSVRHRLISQFVYKGTAFSGVVWECEGLAQDFVDLLRADDIGCTQFYCFGNKFVEYFPEKMWHESPLDPASPLEYAEAISDYIEHNYTTIGGALAAKLTLTAGTYEVTDEIIQGNFDVECDASAGPIIIKPNGYMNIFRVDGTGHWYTSNTTFVSRVTFTSKNDDTVGEVITGSTGSPAKGDYARAVFVSTGGVNHGNITNAEHITLRYAGNNYALFGWYLATADITGSDINIDDLRFETCEMQGNLNYFKSWCGNTRYNRRIGDNFTLKNVKVDGTCTIESNHEHQRGLYFATVCGDVDIENIRYTPADETRLGLFVYVDSATATFSMRNVATKFDVSVGMIAAIWNASNITAEISQCAAWSTGGTPQWGMTIIQYNSGTSTVHIRDCAVQGITGVNARGAFSYDRTGGTLSVELHNCLHYDCTHRLDESGGSFTDTDPISGVDPQWSNLLGGTIDSDCVFSDGMSVTNDAVKEAGSRTVTAAGLSTATDSFDGTQLAGVDTVTCGIYYPMSEFYTPPTPPVPSPDVDDIADLSRTQLRWMRKPNWSRAPDRRFDLNRVIHHDGASTVEITSLNDLLAYRVQCGYLNTTKAEERELLDFFEARKGRTQRFWTPVWKDLFTLASDALVYDDHLTIENAQTVNAFQGHERIFILTNSGHLITRHVTSVAVGPSSTEILYLESVLQRAIDVSDIAYFGRFILARFDSDSLTLRYTSAGVSRVEVRFRELIREYSTGGAAS